MGQNEVSILDWQAVPDITRAPRGTNLSREVTASEGAKAAAVASNTSKAVQAQPAPTPVSQGSPTESSESTLVIQRQRMTLQVESFRVGPNLSRQIRLSLGGTKVGIPKYHLATDGGMFR